MFYLTIFLGIWLTVAIVGFVKKKSATMSIGGGLLLAFISLAFLLTLFEREKETEAIANNIQEPISSNASQTQNNKSSFCTVGYLNKSFEIESEKVNSKDEAELKVLCDTVRDVVKNQINDAKKTLDDVCKTVSKSLQDLGGTTVGGMEKLKREVVSGNEDAKKMLSLARNCKNKTKKQQSLADSFATLSFYSYGEFQFNNTNCKGFVLENLYKSDNGDTIDYQFYAIPPCKRALTINNPFHPTTNPNGTTLFNVLSTINYSGIKPEKIMYKGKEFSLANQPEVNSIAQSEQQPQTKTTVKSEQDEFVIRYSDQILNSLKRGGLCDELKFWLLNINGSDAPANVKERQLDKVLGQAEKMRCLR